MTGRVFLNGTFAGLAICLALQPVVFAQTNRNDGLAINASAQATAKPILMRVIVPLKAEAVSEEKAVERLLNHMESVRKQLESLDAIPESFEFAEPQTSKSAMSMTLATMLLHSAEAALNGAAFEIPELFAASSFVAADWDISRTSVAGIAMMKATLLARITASDIDGRLLKQGFTLEQEDEIFERTKIDIRDLNLNKPWDAMSGTSGARVLYVATIPDADRDASLKSAFQTADKIAKQIATAGGLQLGGVESVTINLFPGVQPQQNEIPKSPTYNSIIGSYNTINEDGYADVAPLTPWEPTFKSNEIRLENLGKLRQTIELAIRYKIH